MKLFCKHNYVKQDETIFCTKCGKQKKVICNHDWVTFRKRELTYYTGRVAIEMKQQCSKCNEIRSIEA